MASTFDTPFFRQSPLSADATHKFFDEDDSILGDSILDPSVVDSSLEMSPPDMDSRRESFAVGQPLFSPKPEDWAPVDMQSIPSTNTNPFIASHQSTNPFAHASQSNGFVSHNGQNWPMSTSGMTTPMHAFDGMPSAFEGNTALSHRPAQTPFSNPSNQVPLFQPVSSHSIPTSPQQDHWMGQSADMSRKSSQTGVTFRSQELRRGDGIRKKNARFDIPRERTLSTIDHLISQSKDEQEIKELKQQKRLLRNRQAALDSRQRKKQHTERLEDEKKAFTHHIGELEDEIEALRHRIDSLMQDNQNCNLHIEKLKFDKEEMIQSHTIETGELRKKIGVLTNHIQSMEASPMQNNVSGTGLAQSNGFGGHFTEMDGLTMDGSWDTMNFLNDYAVEPVDIKQEPSAPAPAKKPELSLVSTNEKPAVQSGLLCMLFLVGAFVLSSRQTPSIPRVSEDVRVASATLLDNVLKDAGLPQTAAGLQAAAPQPSASAWLSAQAVRSGMAGLNGGDSASILGGLSDSLTQPTMAQTNSQLFSLSADQYNGVAASPEYLPQQHHLGDHQQQTSQNRRNLAEALASMQSGASSKADVYTRSLLWDQIPSDVVRTFAKMVAECNSPDIGSEATTTRE